MIRMEDNDELLGHLVDLLNSYPATRDRDDVRDLAATVLPILCDVVGTELSMAADEIAMTIENPEMPWAQGVQSAVDYLRTHAREAHPSPLLGGSA